MLQSPPPTTGVLRKQMVSAEIRHTPDSGLGQRKRFVRWVFAENNALPDEHNLRGELDEGTELIKDHCDKLSRAAGFSPDNPRSFPPPPNPELPKD